MVVAHTVTGPWKVSRHQSAPDNTYLLNSETVHISYGKIYTQENAVFVMMCVCVFGEVLEKFFLDDLIFRLFILCNI